MSAGGLERGIETTLADVYDRLGEKHFQLPCYATGRLRREPENLPDVSLLRVDVDSLVVGKRSMNVVGGLIVTVRGNRRQRLERLTAGDRIGFLGSVRLPSGFDNPGGADATGRLERGRIDALAYVKSALLVEVLERAPLAFSLASRLRQRALRRLELALTRGGAPEEVYAVLSALVTGDRSQLAPELERRFQRAGVFHVMAISGAHVAMLILFLHIVMRRIGLDEVPSLVFLLALLPLYAIFCGARPPVVRAVLMALTVLGGRLLSLGAHRGNTVACAAFLLLVWRPSVLFDAGFQLTFSAVTAIVLLTEPFELRLARTGVLAKPLAISMAAQLGVVPLSAWHFHRLTLLAPIASLVAVPLAAGLVVLGLALVLASDVHFIAIILVRIAELAVKLLSAVASVGAEIPFGSLRVPRPVPLWIVSYVLTLLLYRGRSRLGSAGGAFGLIALILVLAYPRTPSTGRFVMTALDVGHGDAISLSLPEGQTVLVDGGGIPLASLDMGEKVVLPFLLHRSIRRLDVVVITHADFDHIGGLLSLVEEIPIGEIWGGASAWDRRAYRALRQSAKRRNIPFRRLRTGETFSWGGLRWEILAAGGVTSASRGRSTNDQSVVLRITYGRSRVLLTGDAERALEGYLLGQPEKLRADVLKIAHHGSNSSTTPAFLVAVDPSFAVVSARRRSSWRIPSPRVVHRLEAEGIEYARTDRHGAVTIELYPEGGLEVTTKRPLSTSLPARALRAPPVWIPQPTSRETSSGSPRSENDR